MSDVQVRLIGGQRSGEIRVADHERRDIVLPVLVKPSLYPRDGAVSVRTVKTERYIINELVFENDASLWFGVLEGNTLRSAMRALFDACAASKDRSPA